MRQARAAGVPVGVVGVLVALSLVLGAAPASAKASLVAVDDAATTAVGLPIDVDVLANDEGDHLRLGKITEAPGHGTASFVDDEPGVVRYVPEDGFLGVDTFRYRAVSGEVRQEATVTVTVLDRVVATAPARWVVLRPATVSGTGPVGGTVLVRVTGPSTDLPLTATVDAAGRWSVSVTPAQPGTHRVVVTSGAVAADTTSFTVAAKAKYLWVASGALARADVPYSYRVGCPVAPSALRRLTVTYWDWKGDVRQGELVVAARAVADLRYVFRVAFRTKFPIRSMVPVDRFYKSGRSTPSQSDKRSMKADNTSAFNCRPVTGVRYKRSPHSYGTAVDINPRENPYVVSARRMYPKGARTYLDRAHVRKGMLTKKSPVVKAFKKRGWRWGTRFRHPDYQHFDM